MTKILLTGKNGQLGQELQPLLTAMGDVISLGRDDLDLTNTDQISNCLQQYQPDLIINAAAYTAVDKAESEPKTAQAINGTAPKLMAKWANEFGARLFHFSTDYVFDGTNNKPYREKDTPHPLGVYGESKLAGEEAIKANCQDYIIFRTAWVYGVYGKGNFVKTMLRLGKEREELNVVSDQIGTPTWTYNIAQASVELISKLSASPIQEIYHFTNSGVASWYDFAIAIFEEAKALQFPLKINRISPIPTTEYPTPAKRPPYSVLSGEKIAKILSKSPPQWRVSLRAMLKQLQN